MSPVTPRQLLALQEATLDRIKREHPGTTDDEIGSVAGVCRTQVSKWRHGLREISITELVRLVRRFGAPAVLGEVANLDHADIVEREPAVCADLVAMTLDVGDLAQRLTRAAVAGFADRKWSDEELGLVIEGSEGTIRTLRQVQARARELRRA